MTDPRDASPDNGKTRKVPPLAWIIGGLLVLMAAIAFFQYGGSHVTPSGGETPQQKEEVAPDGVMPDPAAEALGDPVPPTAPPPGQTPAPVQVPEG